MLDHKYKSCIYLRGFTSSEIANCELFNVWTGRRGRTSHALFPWACSHFKDCCLAMRYSYFLAFHSQFAEVLITFACGSCFLEGVVISQLCCHLSKSTVVGYMAM